MTSYQTIYNRALAKITDYELPHLSDDDLNDMLHDWLMASIAKFRRCQSDLSQRDDELRTFLVDLLDEEIEILALLMTVEWLEPQINSMLVTGFFIGGKEEKYYSQANHLSELQALRDANRLEARKLMRDYTYFNGNDSYFSS